MARKESVWSLYGRALLVVGLATLILSGVPRLLRRPTPLDPTPGLLLVDDEGTPVREAFVALFEDPEQPLIEARSDVFGRVAIERTTRPLSVRIVPPRDSDLSEAWLRLPDLARDLPTRVVVPARSSARVSGEIEGPGGEILAGLRVEAWSHDESGWRWIGTGLTDATGMFDVPGTVGTNHLFLADEERRWFVVGREEVDAEAAEVWPAAGPFGADTSRYELLKSVQVYPTRGEQTRRIGSIELDPSTRLTLRAVTEGSTPVSGVRVRARDAHSGEIYDAAQSQADGGVALAVPAHASFSLEFDAFGAYPRIFDLGLADKRLVGEASTRTAGFSFSTRSHDLGDVAVPAALPIEPRELVADDAPDAALLVDLAARLQATATRLDGDSGLSVWHVAGEVLGLAIARSGELRDELRAAFEVSPIEREAPTRVATRPISGSRSDHIDYIFRSLHETPAMAWKEAELSLCALTLIDVARNFDLREDSETADALMAILRDALRDRRAGPDRMLTGWMRAVEQETRLREAIEHALRNGAR